ERLEDQALPEAPLVTKGELERGEIELLMLKPDATWTTTMLENEEKLRAWLAAEGYELVYFGGPRQIKDKKFWEEFYRVHEKKIFYDWLTGTYMTLGPVRPIIARRAGGEAVASLLARSRELRDALGGEQEKLGGKMNKVHRSDSDDNVRREAALIMSRDEAARAFDKDALDLLYGVPEPPQAMQRGSWRVKVQTYATYLCWALAFAALIVSTANSVVHPGIIGVFFPVWIEGLLITGTLVAVSALKGFVTKLGISAAVAYALSSSYQGATVSDLGVLVLLSFLVNFGGVFVARKVWGKEPAGRSGLAALKWVLSGSLVSGQYFALMHAPASYAAFTTKEFGIAAFALRTSFDLTIATIFLTLWLSLIAGAVLVENSNIFSKWKSLLRSFVDIFPYNFIYWFTANTIAWTGAKILQQYVPFYFPDEVWSFIYLQVPFAIVYIGLFSEFVRRVFPKDEAEPAAEVASVAAPPLEIRRSTEKFDFCDADTVSCTVDPGLYGLHIAVQENPDLHNRFGHDRDTETPFYINDEHKVTTTIPDAQPDEETISTFEAAHAKEGAHVVAAVDNSSLFVNRGFVTYADGNIFHTYGEEIKAHPYSSLVITKTGEVRMGNVTYKKRSDTTADIKFEGDPWWKRTPIKYATFGQFLLDGKGNPRERMEEIIPEFQDMRHVFSVPRVLLDKDLGIAPDSIAGRSEGYFGVSQLSANGYELAKRAWAGPVLLEPYIEVNFKEGNKIRKERVPVPEDKLRELFRRAHHVEVGENEQVTTRGTFNFKDGKVNVFFRPGVYPRTLVGVDGNNRLVIAGVEGKSRRIGSTLEDSIRLAIKLGLKQAMLMDHGGSAKIFANGEYVLPSSEDRYARTSALLVTDRPVKAVKWWQPTWSFNPLRLLIISVVGLAAIAAVLFLKAIKVIDGPVPDEVLPYYVTEKSKQHKALFNLPHRISNMSDYWQGSLSQEGFEQFKKDLVLLEEFAGREAYRNVVFEISPAVVEAYDIPGLIGIIEKALANTEYRELRKLEISIKMASPDSFEVCLDRNYRPIIFTCGIEDLGVRLEEAVRNRIESSGGETPKFEAPKIEQPKPPPDIRTRLVAAPAAQIKARPRHAADRAGKVHPLFPLAAMGMFFLAWVPSYIWYYGLLPADELIFALTGLGFVASIAISLLTLFPRHRIIFDTTRTLDIDAARKTIDRFYQKEIKREDHDSEVLPHIKALVGEQANKILQKEATNTIWYLNRASRGSVARVMRFILRDKTADEQLKKDIKRVMIKFDWPQNRRTIIFKRMLITTVTAAIAGGLIYYFVPHEILMPILRSIYEAIIGLFGETPKPPVGSSMVGMAGVFGITGKRRVTRLNEGQTEAKMAKVIVKVLAIPAVRQYGNEAVEFLNGFAGSMPSLHKDKASEERLYEQMMLAFWYYKNGDEGIRFPNLNDDDGRALGHTDIIFTGKNRNGLELEVAKIVKNNCAVESSWTYVCGDTLIIAFEAIRKKGVYGPLSQRRISAIKGDVEKLITAGAKHQKIAIEGTASDVHKIIIGTAHKLDLIHGVDIYGSNLAHPWNKPYIVDLKVRREVKYFIRTMMDTIAVLSGSGAVSQDDINILTSLIEPSITLIENRGKRCEVCFKSCVDAEMRRCPEKRETLRRLRARVIKEFNKRKSVKKEDVDKEVEIFDRAVEGVTRELDEMIWRFKRGTTKESRGIGEAYEFIKEAFLKYDPASCENIKLWIRGKDGPANLRGKTAVTIVERQARSYRKKYDESPLGSPIRSTMYEMYAMWNMLLNQLHRVRTLDSGIDAIPLQELVRAEQRRLKYAVHQLREEIRTSTSRLYLEEFVDEVGKRAPNLIKTKNMTALSAAEELARAAEEYIAKSKDLSETERESRRSGVRLVIIRLAELIEGDQLGPINIKGKEDIVLFVEAMDPSRVWQIKRNWGDRVKTIVCPVGSANAHWVVLARQLGFNVIAAAHYKAGKKLPLDPNDIEAGQPVLVDTAKGIVTVNPEEKTVKSYTERKKVLGTRERFYLSKAKDPAGTKDGSMLKVLADVGNLDQIPDAVHHGAEGVGLYRTEWLYDGARRLTEDEMEEIFVRASEKLSNGKPLTLRLLDMRDDKLPSTLAPSKYMGCDYYFSDPEGNRVATEELKAMMKAYAKSRKKNIEILIPMV
ncbi:MAG: phosphodiester glycosidase family protein, partial [Candidatus Omnitrophica bacterium]|nr:phosphodiester glycosidase family protein [Candidatus Omnitrophota bacterium]